MFIECRRNVGMAPLRTTYISIRGFEQAEGEIQVRIDSLLSGKYDRYEVRHVFAEPTVTQPDES